MAVGPGDWSRMREVFEAARALPHEARSAYLANTCGGDDGLRREVEALLDSHHRAAGFLEQPAHLTPIPEPVTTHLEGQRIGPYLVHARIGAGGMGEVYKARDTRLDRTVAIKVLPAHVAMDPATRERFDREARAVAALNHPHICTLHDVGEAPSPDPAATGAQSIRFFVMEFVEGTTLDSVDQLPMETERATAIAAQVCDALEAAHDKGIVHRDIKPQNIMVSPRGHVKVLDFGVAKLDAGTTDRAVDVTQPRTRTGLIMGTLPYMSPEQMFGDPITGASDIFSLGVVLYQLVTGRHPFTPAGSQAQMQALAHALLVHTPMSPRRFNAAIPVPFEQLILRMLEKEPTLRPTAADARQILRDPATRNAAPAARVAGRSSRRHTVGRQRERALLDQAFDEATAGHPLLLTVAGEPGIGKTTTVEEFLTGVRAAGRSYVARGRCSERLAGSEAYLPVLEALESLLVGDDRHSGAQSLMAELAPTWYAQVAPAGHGGNTGVGAQLELKNASQERMKRELRTFLEAVARVKPLVVFFDDVHWADASTTDLLGYISSQFAGARVLVVVTYRPTDLLLAKHPFAALKLDLAARGLCREVLLGFLSLDETARYLELEFPGHDFPPTLAALIHGKTEGSPLFMVDLVRDLRDREVIVPAENGWTLAQSVPALERDLPESVRSMIERKIGQLVDDDRQLLVCASVQGHAFDSAVVAKALERDPADIEERLEVLDRVHAFVSVLGEDALPTGVPTLRCRFVHVLYQNALYASLRATRRAALSAAVANTMIEYHGADNAAIASQLAILFETARDPARAAHYFLVASQNALRVFAFVEAAAIAERGLKLLSSLPDSPERNTNELKLQIALGTAWVAIKGYAAPDVERAYGRARELCRQIGDSAELASVLFGLHVYYVVVPSYQTSLELGDEMLAVAAREHNDALRVQGLLTHGMARFWLGDVAIGTAVLDEGIALYDQQRRNIFGKTPLFDHGVGCRRYHAVCLWLLGYPEKAAQSAREAVADARSIKQPLTLASTLGFVSMLHYFRRDVAAARETAAEAVACTREYVLTFWLGFSSALHGWSIAHAAGAADDLPRWEDGAAEIRASIEAHRNAGARTFGPIAWALLAETYLLQSRFADAEAAVGEGLALANATDERFWEAELHRLRGELCQLQGFASEAEQHFERAIAVARKKDEKSLELRALVSLYSVVRDNPGDRAAQVRDQLAQTYGWFTEGFDTVDLRAAKALLD
jgi:serine/threonine protein kinase/tetratricopeptide (TPR) repeat protein